MIRKLLLAATLLTAANAALAHGDSGYGRVVSVEPRVSISFGTGYYDGFRVLYESGGHHYWTRTPYYPGPVILVPAPYRVQHVHHHHRDRWEDRRYWRGYRHEDRDDRRPHRY